MRLAGIFERLLFFRQKKSEQQKCLYGIPKSKQEWIVIVDLFLSCKVSEWNGMEMEITISTTLPLLHGKKYQS